MREIREDTRLVIGSVREDPVLAIPGVLLVLATVACFIAIIAGPNEHRSREPTRPVHIQRADPP